MLTSRYFLYLFCLFLSACATLQKPPAQSQDNKQINQQHLDKLNAINGFALKGRLGVVTQKQGFSGSMHWQHDTQEDNIDVFSPLGGKVAHINKTAQIVTLTTQDNQKITAQNAESLTEKTLGFRLPLTGLSDWTLGKPSSNKIDASTWDAQGRLLTLKQDGWNISYENYAEIDGIFLPNKITLKSEQLNLKLLVENWSNISQ